MSSVLSQILLAAGGSVAWQTTFSQTLNSDSTGWSGYNIRQVINSSLLSVSGSSQVRVTLAAAAGTSGFVIDHAEIGHAAASGNAYDFDGTQVALTFSGGGAGVTVAQGATVLSDAVSYSLNNTKNFVVALHFSSTSSLRVLGVLSGASAAYKFAASEVATSVVSGYTGAAAAVNCVSKIEVQ